MSEFNEQEIAFKEDIQKLLDTLGREYYDMAIKKSIESDMDVTATLEIVGKSFINLGTHYLSIVFNTPELTQVLFNSVNDKLYELAESGELYKNLSGSENE